VPQVLPEKRLHRRNLLVLWVAILHDCRKVGGPSSVVDCQNEARTVINI